MARTDDNLVAESLAGSAAAFDELMLRYQRLVCTVALSSVKERQNALDVTQNVFLKVYQNLGSVKPGGMFKPWLLRITYNESINWLRKHRHREDQEETVDFEAAVVSDAEQETRVVKRESQRLLLRGLEKLNPKYKMAVALRYAEGMRIREIADAMECSEGMVKSLLFRGVRQIRHNVVKAP